MPVDLSQKRMVTIAEVAELFRCSTWTVARKVACGAFPVLPRDGGKRGTPWLWSSVDLARYIDGDGLAGKRTAKRGTKGGAK